MQLQAELANLIGSVLCLGLRRRIATRGQRGHSDFHEGNLAIRGRLEGAQVTRLNTVLGQFRANAGNQHIVVGVLVVRSVFQKTEVNQVTDELGSGVRVLGQLARTLSRTSSLTGVGMEFRTRPASRSSRC